MKTLLILTTLFLSLVYFSFFIPKSPPNINKKMAVEDTVYIYTTANEDELGKIGIDTIEGDQLIITVTALEGLPISTEKLMAYYPFEYNFCGTNGNKTCDMSGFENHGSIRPINSTVFLEGSSCNTTNHYFSDNGVNGYIKVGRNIRPYRDITFSMWIWIDEEIEDTMTLFHNDDMNVANVHASGLAIQITPEKKLLTWIGSGTNLNLCQHRKQATLNPVLVPNQWQHITVTFELHSYVNPDIIFPEGCSLKDCINRIKCPCFSNKPLHCIKETPNCVCHDNLENCLHIDDTIQIYVDGAEKSMGDWTGCGSLLTYTPLDKNREDGKIGIQSDHNEGVSKGFTHNFLGKLDDLLVFNRILSEEEIQKLTLTRCGENIGIIGSPPPTGFTPNNDSFNDCFIIPSLQVRPNDYPDNELIVYSSNGQIVYRASPYQNDWCGNGMEGKELPIGSYGYVYIAGNGEKPIKAMVSINR